MSVQTVRDFLIKQMAELAAVDTDTEEASKTVELAVAKARASAVVADAYTNTMRAQTDALRVAVDSGFLRQDPANTKRLLEGVTGGQANEP